MNILIITPDYPDDNRNVFPFVKQLADELARVGHCIHIIAPYSLSHNKKFPKRVTDYVVGKGVVTVYRPSLISFSNIKLFGKSITDIIKRFAFKRGIKLVKAKVDVVYGHFWDSAYMGFSYAYNHNLPLYVASGESEIDFRCDNSEKKVFCEYVSGVICVSTKNKDESIQLGLTTENKCVVIPNAINPNLFYKQNKEMCRKELNLPLDAFIVSFVGWFSNRKGSKRVSRALTMINNGDPVYSVFIGEGEEEPDCSNILFKGTLAHSRISSYLNASDVFVLPTLHEGCCNSIIEAMACGLPVVSSNLPFNKDICDESNSILIDPMNIEAIKDAIVKLRDDKAYRHQLSNGALKTAKSLSIDKRAEHIIAFFNSCM